MTICGGDMLGMLHHGWPPVRSGSRRAPASVMVTPDCASFCVRYSDQAASGTRALTAAVRIGRTPPSDGKTACAGVTAYCPKTSAHSGAGTASRRAFAAAGAAHPVARSPEIHPAARPVADRRARHFFSGRERHLQRLDRAESGRGQGQRQLLIVECGRDTGRAQNLRQRGQGLHGTGP